MAETRDGMELVEHALRVIRNPEADWREQTAAREWLGNYGFGKAPQTVTVETEADVSRIDFSSLTSEQLEALIAIKIVQDEPVEPTEH